MKYAKQTTLKYDEYPFAIWGFGILMLILGLVLLYKIIWDRDEATFTGRFW